ncbi:MAG: DUF4340 domain-containing protein [Clostridiales bacterium]|nr:DUF4340 domain-containing protein [Clostridiales bacterium]
MNSKIKGIIVGGVFTLCLAVVAIVLGVTGNFEKGNSSDSSNSSNNSSIEEVQAIPLVNFKSAQVKHVLIENTYGKINVSQTKDGEEDWTVDELEGITQIVSIKSGIATNASTLSAKDLVEENATDLAKYGLDQPQSKFTTQFSDTNNTTKVFLIGDESPEMGYYYVTEEGTNKVYTVQGNKLLYFMQKVEYFVNLTILAEPSSETEWPTIEDLSVERKDWDYAVRFRTEENQVEGLMSSQVMYEPIYSSLNITHSTAVTHGMWGLAAADTEKVFPTDEDFKTYGISEPNAKVTMKTPNITYTLYIGNPIYTKDDEGKDTAIVQGYYAYIEGVKGINAIYIIEPDSVPWATFEAVDVISSLMTTNPIGTVKSIVVDKSGEKDVFKLIGATEENTKDLVVTINDKINADVDQFKLFYQELISCPTNEIYFKEPTGNLYMTVSINLGDSEESDVIQFYTDTDRRYIIKLNGAPTFRVSSKWVEQFVENIQNLKDGKEVKSYL